jgi:hypothetical protein
MTWKVSQACYQEPGDHAINHVPLTNNEAIHLITEK